MKQAFRDDRLAVPTSWETFPQGKWLNKQVERQLNKWWPRVFGYHLLKLGHLSAEINTSLCPIKHQVNVTEEKSPFSGVVADSHFLPFSEHSVDAVLLAHTLDHTHDPHQILREAHRVLMPDGYLIITGFNPYSLCGLARFLPQMRNKLPWSGRFFSPNRVTDWLSVLGCEVIDQERFVYRSLMVKPSGFSQKMLIKNRWLAKMSHQYLSPIGCVYMLVARKRELPLTPIKQKWKVNTKIRQGVVGTARTHL
ncbi:methyltransferase domain-containing protein [Catenovulum sp. SM1970]|uniref:class I SAM-dependent methyltransferase n=1 Tax=Marinifaba aquimaris TaxID=2741323 RepID=UPI00157431C0|nr:class I SAM-dependent methyltransferase [Marinifaba aquimaris]NTS77855.1 methyltransferase domain-containing protein [Marinifaba aquimaris]